MFIFMVMHMSLCVCVPLRAKRLAQSCPTLRPYVARQAPLSMGFSRQESWSRLSFPTPENLPNPGIEPLSPAL